jgi:DNA polymerase III psi subunit
MSTPQVVMILEDLKEDAVQAQWLLGWNLNIHDPPTRQATKSTWSEGEHALRADSDTHRTTWCCIQEATH